MVPTIDLKIYLTAAAGGVPILFLVFGLVQLLKKLKRPDGTPSLGGNALLLISLTWGILLGTGYMTATTLPPAGFVWPYWFGVGCYGLGLGFLASLFWDGLKAIAQAAVAKMVQHGLEPPEKQ